VDAKKSTLSAREALALLDEVDEVFAAKGRRVAHVDLTQSRPGAEELKALVLGPTGNLRAPTLRVGRRLLVGFEEETWRRVFGV
jgi:arsenate reductase-like glutaredoxin family protein